MTNEEIINAFPECERIKKADVAECVNKAMAECKSWREIHSRLWYHCQKFWPQPKYRREDHADYDEWSNYFSGNYDTREFYFRDWIKSIEEELRRRVGQRRTFDEACQLAADEWARMIFGTHIQNNGDQSDAGGMAMVLGTLVKDKAKSGYGSETVEKFRSLMADYYRGGCQYKDDYGTYDSEPYCDYHPNSPLADILIKAGCDSHDVGSMCPWKTGIHIDEYDHSVIIRGYQTERYI